MHRRPPEDDEQQEDLEQLRTRPQTQQRQRPASAQRSRTAQTPYHYDEHPEVPRVRRASLQQSPAQKQQPSIQMSQKTRLREPDTEVTHVSGTPKKYATSATRRPYQYDEGEIDRTTTSLQRKHLPSVEPPPRVHRPRPPQAKRTLKGQLQHLSHNQGFIVIASLALVALIILIPVIYNVSHSQPHNTVVTTAAKGTPAVGPSSASANAHEIVITPEDTDHPAPPVFATSAYLLNADTGATLYAYNPFTHLPMLSTTKLMTALLAAEQGKPDQPITITSQIENDVSKLSADSSVFGFKKGETYSLRDMLYALILDSGNDAAIAIADTLAGSLPIFVQEMNLRAHQLGLYDTHYVNPHGLLDPGQYSSAHDLAILARYVFRNPLIRTIAGTKTYTMPAAGNHPVRVLINGDQFLWWYPGVDAGKPGYDGGSNFVQVISAVRNGKHLIGVVMHTVNWWTDMRDLLNWGFDNFTWVSPHDADIQHPPIPYDNLWNYFASDKKTNTITGADGSRYYVYTGYSINGLIMRYFDQSGSLPKFGYPTAMLTVTSAGIESQKFQHGTIQCNLVTKQCSTV
ncbi:MAG TPA: D-alanyl-D-alanine carboxypeptidase family protein [Ktedonobacteraceae bacterium]|nr:D-alanyl-D-alanine carboxypeptidase family protein [Ktedonobacteraceae bacterium]